LHFADCGLRCITEANRASCCVDGVRSQDLEFMLNIPCQMRLPLNRLTFQPHLKHLVLHLDLEDIRLSLTANMLQLNQLTIVALNDFKQCVELLIVPLSYVLKIRS